MSAAHVISVADICSVVLEPAARSVAATEWVIVTTLWPWYWLLICVALAFVVAFEIATRHGSFHYNSENGFSPAFNRFVGSGTNLGLQSLLIGIFHWLFGDIVYCLKWPYVVHGFVFLATGLALHLSGFWPYLWEPRKRRSVTHWHRSRRNG